jgi:uncharacterized protein YkwD
MNILQIWAWLTALPALLLPGLNFDQAPAKQTTQEREKVKITAPSPTPAPSKSPVVRTPKSTPKSTPSPTPAPSASAAPRAAAATEIASEQVCPGQTDASKTVPALVCLTSNARKFHGRSAVQGDSALMAAAAAKAGDMARCGYGHTACGRAFSYWIENKGYTGNCYAENIAMGQRTPREVFIGWMNSAGHRANILNRDYNEIGVAQTPGSRGLLWVMHLGGC